MSRAAKATLGISVVLSVATVWGVHFMQVQEREASVLVFTSFCIDLLVPAQVMHRGVERDEARQAEKRRQRALDLERNQAREREFQKMQPTKGWLFGKANTGQSHAAESSTPA